jgi:hypothetical protein
MEFLEAKASPLLGLMIDLGEGKDFSGEKIQMLPELQKGEVLPSREEYFKSQVGRRLSPMIVQDMYDLYDEDPNLMGLMAPSFFGASVQVHKRRLKRHAQ